jgi:gas vesicle protein
LWKAQGWYVCPARNRSIPFVQAVPSELPRKKKKMNTNSQEFERKQSGNSISVLLGMVIGSLVGAVTMLLFAPQPGEKTRAELQDSALKLRDRTTTTLKDTMTQVSSKANQIKADMQIKAQELNHQGKDLLVRQLDNVSHAADAGKKAIQGSANHTVV